MNPLLAASRPGLVLAALALALFSAPRPAQAQKAAPVQLRHAPTESAEREKELVLRANIVAAAGAYLPTLYYRTVGETRYYSLPMLPVPGSINIYAASVPGLFVTQDLEYYLESYDTQLRGPGRAGDAKKPLQVKVVDPVVPPSQVVIRSEPSDAELSIDGQVVGRTPWLGVLKAGGHEMILKKEGFLEVVSTLEVPESRDLEILRSLPAAAERAFFAVTSEPPGATVSIDGQVLGETPLLAPSPEGEHTLFVEKQGFARAERTLLFAKDRSIETSFNLVRLPPEPALAVTTEPPGATVFVDGKELGRTPFLGVVPAGEHTLLLTMPGRRNAQAQIVMPEDRDLDLRFGLVDAGVKRDPVIAINSDPSGASIFIEGKELAEKTPYIGQLPAGVHSVRLVAEGFQPYERKITMSDSNDMELTLALVALPPPPGPSRVSIESELSEVEISVDGKSAGKAPLTLELEAGAHVAVAKKDGYRSVEERFVVRQGEAMRFKLALTPLEKGVEDPLLSVRTDVEGATVILDGVAMEMKTPFSQALKPGKHTLLVTKEGYKARTESFELPADRTFELRYAFALEPIRKSVQLSSAAEAKKELEKPVVPIVDTEEVQSAGKPAPKAAAPAPVEAPKSEPAPTTSAPSAKVDTGALAQLKAAAAASNGKVKLQYVYVPDKVEVGPIILAGTGAVLAGVGVLYGISSMQTANSIGDETLAVTRDYVIERHNNEVKLAVGLGAAGVLLAGAGAIWGALKDDPPPGAIPVGSGGEVQGLDLQPLEGGAMMSVKGRF